ncbi:hypothetical protein ACTHPZ_11870 [Bacillus halotolerans]
MTKQFIKKILYVSSLANERTKSEGYENMNRLWLPDPASPVAGL